MFFVLLYHPLHIELAEHWWKFQMHYLWENAKIVLYYPLPFSQFCLQTVRITKQFLWFSAFFFFFFQEEHLLHAFGWVISQGCLHSGHRAHCVDRDYYTVQSSLKIYWHLLPTNRANSVTSVVLSYCFWFTKICNLVLHYIWVALLL